MKKYILFTIIAFVAFSCETKTVEVEKSGGVWYLGGDDQFPEGRSPKAVIGSDDDVEMVGRDI